MTECWEWDGSHFDAGYARCGKEGKAVHRVIFEAIYGLIPEGFELHHECRNKGCCNPFHLEVVSVLQHRGYHKNEIPMAAVNKAKTHCPQGHEYTTENTYLSRRGNSTMRHCVICRKLMSSKMARKRKLERADNREQKRINKQNNTHSIS